MSNTSVALVPATQRTMTPTHAPALPEVTFAAMMQMGQALVGTGFLPDKHTETFTMDDARKAGLLSSGMYTKFPKAMLRSRAITAALKSIGWEGGSGVYDPSELPADPTPEPVREIVRKIVREDAPAVGTTLEQAENVMVGKGEKRVRLGDTRTERLQQLEAYYGQKGDEARLAAVQIVLASRDDETHTETLEAVEVEEWTR